MTVLPWRSSPSSAPTSSNHDIKLGRRADFIIVIIIIFFGTLVVVVVLIFELMRVVIVVLSNRCACRLRGRCDGSLSSRCPFFLACFAFVASGQTLNDSWVVRLCFCQRVVPTAAAALPINIAGRRGGGMRRRRKMTGKVMSVVLLLWPTSSSPFPSGRRRRRK